MREVAVDMLLLRGEAEGLALLDGAALAARDLERELAVQQEDVFLRALAVTAAPVGAAGGDVDAVDLDDAVVRDGKAGPDAVLAGHVLRRREAVDIDEIRVLRRRLREIRKLHAQAAHDLAEDADGWIGVPLFDGREHALAHAGLLRDDVEAHALGLADAVEIDGDIV